ncbi:MAG: helix-turn-helix transcriptional regulator [Candidatus Faecousia sp.]|nr:helix-turn-helix transcriptional regulator [Eubacteriales bacterium]MDY6067829.1 helix-turn-helix transcriptional regulator [Candidatus Faecousia sp.]
MSTNKLKGKIAEAGFSQRSLANALGMSKNTLNSKVNGKTPFNTVEIQQICEKLGITDLSEKASIFLSQSS